MRADAALPSAFAAAWGLANGAVIAQKRQGSVWRATLAGRDVIVKTYPADASRTRLYFLTSWLRFLRADGGDWVRAQPVASGHGCFVAVDLASVEHRYAWVQSYDDAAAFDAAQHPIPDVLAALTEALVGMHAATRRFLAGMSAPERARSLALAAGSSDARRALADVRAELERRLAMAHDDGSLPRQIVHGDVNPSNVRVAAGGRVSLIDFDDFRLASPLYDLARPLVALLTAAADAVSNDDLRQLASVLAAGYAAHSGCLVDRDAVLLNAGLALIDNWEWLDRERDSFEISLWAALQERHQVALDQILGLPQSHA